MNDGSQGQDPLPAAEAAADDAAPETFKKKGEVVTKLKLKLNFL